MDARHTLKCDIYKYDKLRNLYWLATALKIRPNHEYWCKCTWQTSGINKTATSDWLDLRWQLSFQWHRRGIDLVLQVPRLFHNATVSQCDHFLLLHMYMYLLFEASPGWLPGWRGFFYLNFGGGTQLQCIYYLCRILISRPPRVFRCFKRRSCSSWKRHLMLLQK